MRRATAHRILVCGTLSLVSIAAADVVVTNLDQPIRGVTLLATTPPDNVWAAQAFKVPDNYTLDSIDLILGNADAPDAFAELRKGDDPGGPVLTTLTIAPIELVGTAVATLTPDSSVILRPGTTYWLIVGTASTGSFGWAYAQGNAMTGPGTISNYAYSYDQGATWGPQAIDNPYLISVNATFTPCPCPADFDASGGTPDTTDIDAFFTAWLLGEPAADADCSGGTPDTTDIDAFFQQWLAGGC
jgi:hypothetical protein